MGGLTSFFLRACKKEKVCASDSPVDAESDLELTADRIERAALSDDPRLLRSLLKSAQKTFPPILDHIDKKRRKSGKRCLLSAAVEGGRDCGNSIIIAILLESGSDCLEPDGCHESPFLYASRRDMQEIVRLMRRVVTGMSKASVSFVYVLTL